MFTSCLSSHVTYHQLQFGGLSLFLRNDLADALFLEELHVFVGKEVSVIDNENIDQSDTFPQGGIEKALDLNVGPAAG